MKEADMVNVDEMNRIKWWHKVVLPGNVETPGVVDCKLRLEEARFPVDLHNRTVLDIGAWDGYFSFECERRGAARVVALDSTVWHMPGGNRGFEFAHENLKSKVEPVHCDVYDLTPERVGGLFDLVIFMGVLYHIKDPLYVFERVARVCRDMLIMETHVDLLDIGRPAVAFYPDDTCANDSSNWCGPNLAFLEMMLRLNGFYRFEYTNITSPIHYNIVNEETQSRFGRVTLHAWK
jgi:tRNA (mo5U34)-methyltransferase